MKYTFLLILLLTFIMQVAAQQPVSGIYAVYFTDKGGGKSSVFNPESYLSSKAIERRMKQHLSFDQSDIPVNAAYVKSVAETGANVISRSRWFNFILINASADEATQISALPFVAKVHLINAQTKQVNSTSAEKSFFLNESATPLEWKNTEQSADDLYNYGASYNQINQIKGQGLHNSGFSGQGMTIAVIDAGFNSVDILPCFDQLRAGKQILGARDFAVPGNNVYATTMNSHGTKVLSCMGANISGQMVGTAPKANYWLLRSEVAESESIIEEYYWLNAAEFADSVGADLINSSLGYTTFDNAGTNHSYADMDGNTTVITRAADKAAEKGILVVNSAGNSGGAGWWYIGAPADADSVFTIGAVDAAGIRATFSSVGPTYDRRIKPTVAAQGQSTVVYGPSGLTAANGTSFSSPIICGMSACLWQAWPNLTNMQIIDVIKATASQSGSPDSLLGWGIPDYSRAVLVPTSIHNQKTGKLAVYPNPVSDHLVVILPEQGSGNYQVEISDLQGRKIYTYQADGIENKVIQLGGLGFLPLGVYLVRISDGHRAYTGKIIKIKH